MNKRRLQLTIDTLRNVKEANFDLGSWKCGTTACAVGWVGLSPWAAKEGFRLDSIKPVFEEPNEERATEWDAVEFFYDIDCKTSTRLFVWSSYAEVGYDTTEAVIYRINLLLRVGEKAFNKLSDSQIIHMTKNHINMMKEVQ